MQLIITTRDNPAVRNLSRYIHILIDVAMPHNHTKILATFTASYEGNTLHSFATAPGSKKAPSEAREMVRAWAEAHLPTEGPGGEPERVEAADNRDYEVRSRGQGMPVLVLLAKGEWCGERLCESKAEAHRRGEAWVERSHVIGEVK